MTRSSHLHKSGSEQSQFNPYRIGVGLILRRLIWDLSLTSWGQRKKIKLLRGRHKGKKAIILCNGPSLRDVDFSSIEGIYTFGLNKINLMFNQTKFRPSCIVAVNPFVIEQNMNFYSSTNIPLFLDRYATKCGITKRDNISLLDSCDFPFFARDCSMSIFQGYTVTYVAFQLAYHMGFEEVCLIGCDHNFYREGIPNKTYTNNSKDISHFHEEYFATGQVWQFPDLLQSEVYYSRAKNIYEQDGRKIVNASTRTNLKIFERVRLEDFIN